MALNLDPIQTKGGSLPEIKLPGVGVEEFLPCTPSQVFFLNDTRSALQADTRRREMGSATPCPAILGQAVASS